jgi:hypothetical protein
MARFDSGRIAVARHYAEVVAACRKRVAELARIAPRQGPGATVTTPPSPSAWRSRRFPLVVGLARFAPRLPEAMDLSAEGGSEDSPVEATNGVANREE